jgi:hypothetical protein
MLLLVLGLRVLRGLYARSLSQPEAGLVVFDRAASGLQGAAVGAAVVGLAVVALGLVAGTVAPSSRTARAAKPPTGDHG